MPLFVFHAIVTRMKWNSTGVVSQPTNCNAVSSSRAERKLPFWTLIASNFFNSFHCCFHGRGGESLRLYFLVLFCSISPSILYMLYVKNGKQYSSVCANTTFELLISVNFCGIKYHSIWIKINEYCSKGRIYSKRTLTSIRRIGKTL